MLAYEVLGRVSASVKNANVSSNVVTGLGGRGQKISKESPTNNEREKGAHRKDENRGI